MFITKKALSRRTVLRGMLRWYEKRQRKPGNVDDGGRNTARELFRRELFGIDESLDRVIEYFKAASAGSDVSRRLLLLLGPPSGGKSTIVILLKRGLEEYSHTDEGAVYGLQGSPIRENPLVLVPASLRAQFRDTYGVEIVGELSPLSRVRLEQEYEGDFMVRVPLVGERDPDVDVREKRCRRWRHCRGSLCPGAWTGQSAMTRGRPPSDVRSSRLA